MEHGDRMPTEHMFSDYIKSYSVCRGSMHSHTSMKPPGLFHIPVNDLPEFYKNYSEALAESCDLSITEAHRYISPLLVDLDFKVSSEQDTDKHIYDDTIVSQIVDAYCKRIGECFIISEDIDVFVLEKKKPTFVKKQKKIKDGIHIIFPNIVAKCDAQYALRESLLDSIGEIISGLNCVNDIGDIVDEAVIEKNNWMMYGSKKPDCNPYIVTKRFKYNVQKSDLYSVSYDEYSLNDLVNLFSIRNKYDDTDMTPELMPAVRIINERMDNKWKHDNILKSVINTDDNKKVKNTIICLDQVVKLISVLNRNRVNDYTDWVRLGWCFKNIDERLLDQWEEISKKSEKYIPGECKKIWRSMKSGGLGIGTLHMWAKIDNPAAYKEIVRNDLQELIFQSRTGTHTDVAKVIFNMYQHEYACSSVKYKSWYEFKQHRWSAVDGAVSLRLKMSDDVWREYVTAARDWSQKAIDASASDKQTMYQENAKKMSELALKLKITSFKDNVMKECSELFYKEGFENSLDLNLNLICFTNGVYDLDTQEFREGRPEDKISFSTNTQYIPYDPSAEYVLSIKKYMAQVLVKPNVREYVLKLFSTFLHGAVKEQKFYLWTGSGSNSKSMLIELFESAFGDYCCKFPITLLTQKRAASNAATSEIARAKGKRFACLQEPSEDEKINIGLMKELSGGDKIMARAIFKEPVEFKPQFKLLLLCNHLPSVPSDDGGTWRRIRVVEFTSKFVDHPVEENEFPIDLELSEKMEKWKEYFIPMLIEYHKLYKKEGITEPEEVLACTKDYKRNNDHLADFIHNCIEKDTNSFLSLNDAFVDLKAWSKDDNIQMKIPTKAELEKYLSKNIGKCISRNNFKGYKGYKIKNRYQENMIEDE